MPEDLLASAKDTVAAFIQAVRCGVKYPPGHPRRTETLEFFTIRATNHGDRWGELRLDAVPPKAIAFKGTTVYEDGAPDGPPIAKAFVSAGIRSLTLGSGIAKEELQQLIDIFGRAGRSDEDVASALWRLGIWAIQIETDDDLDSGDSEVAAVKKHLEEARAKARADDLVATPPEGRDEVLEAPPPQPLALEETRAQLAPGELHARAFEVVRTALWRADAPVAAEHATKILIELLRRTLQIGDLAMTADFLDRADPEEAPPSALKAAEKTTAALGGDIVRHVPALYARTATQGEDAALGLALRCLGHLDSAGVQRAAVVYADTPAAGRRPLRRLLSARGAEALDSIVRIADHKNLEIAKDGLAMLAVTPLEAARKAIERFVSDPTTPRDRLELAKGALSHHQQIAPKASKTTVSAVSQQLCVNLRDPSREKRLAAARSLAKMSGDQTAFKAIEALVTLPGFPQADDEEQKALIEALAGSGGEQAIKVLDQVAMKTLGLPTSRMCRNAADTLKRARGAKT
jgi:hypothetical protein